MTKERTPTATKDGQKGKADNKVAAVPSKDAKATKDTKVDAKATKDTKVDAKAGSKDAKEQKGGAKGAKGEAKEIKDQKAPKDGKESKDQKPQKAEEAEGEQAPKAVAAVQAVPAPQANSTGKMRNVVYQDYMTPNTNKSAANAKGNKVRREKNKFVASYGDREEQSTPRPAVEKNSGNSPKDAKKGGKAGVKA